MHEKSDGSMVSFRVELRLGAWWNGRCLGGMENENNSALVPGA